MTLLDLFVISVDCKCHSEAGVFKPTIDVSPNRNYLSACGCILAA